MNTLASTLALSASALLLTAAAPTQDTQVAPTAPAATLAPAVAPPTAPTPPVTTPSTPPSTVPSTMPPTTPSTADLIAARARVADFLDRAEGRGMSDDQRVALRRNAQDLQAWIDRSADITPATERVAMPRSAGPGAANVIARIQRGLVAVGARIDIAYDMDLRQALITGPRWEVDDARAQIEHAFFELEQRLRDDEAQQRLRAEDLALTRAKEAERALRASTVDIAWTGGTLADLVAAVRTERDCNVVLATPAAGEVEIPPFRVRLVTPAMLFTSLNALLADGPISLRVEVIDPPAAPQQTPDATPLEPLPVIVIRRKTPPLAQELHDLSGWNGANDAGIKSLVEAIDFAMQNAGSADLVSLRYHEPTKLLFVKAPVDSLALIREIVHTVRTK